MTYNSIIANTYGVRLYFCLPVIAVRVSGGHLCEAEATDRAGRRDRRKVRGNPFFLFRVLRILSRSALRMTSRLVIANAVGRVAIRSPIL